MGYILDKTYTFSKQASKQASKQYNHFISLGYFCSVALELERIGLRSNSSPFDWLISDFIGVLDAIENHFSGFLEYDYLFQSKQYHEYYKNEKYNVHFFHDFNQYQSLNKQLPKVKEKYDRRIEKFYRNIAEPTLFVRYISDEKKNADEKSIELEWIENNYTQILNLLKSFNKDNDIIFIANNNVSSQLFEIYNVVPDEEDVVARKPLERNKELNFLLCNINYDKRKKNLEIYNKKMKKKNSFVNRSYNCVIRGIKKRLLKEYIHDKQY